MKLCSYRLLISIIAVLSLNLNSEVLEEVVVLEKKIKGDFMPCKIIILLIINKCQNIN